MKRVLLAVAAALIFLSTMAVPNVAHADAPGGGCPAPGCKP